MDSTHYPGGSLRTPATTAATSTRGRLAQSALVLVLALGAANANAQNADPIAAFASNTPVSPSDAMAASNVLIRAISLVGTPYRWGGNTPESGFDCSGLVAYVFRDMLDLRLPRNSRELAVWQGADPPADALRSGDLVFFAHAGTITHVGIYVGDGRFVHAPSSGGTVRLDRLDAAYWQSRYAGAKRVLPNS